MTERPDESFDTPVNRPWRVFRYRDGEFLGHAHESLGLASQGAPGQVGVVSACKGTDGVWFPCSPEYCLAESVWCES